MSGVEVRQQLCRRHVWTVGLPGPDGAGQAEALADRLARTGELADASVLLASVLPRAVETAEIVAPALGGLEVTQACDFCELHVGAADGLLSWEEFRETR